MELLAALSVTVLIALTIAVGVSMSMRPAVEQDRYDRERAGYEVAERWMKSGMLTADAIKLKVGGDPDARRGAERAIANWKKSGWN